MLNIFGSDILKVFGISENDKEMLKKIHKGINSIVCLHPDGVIHLKEMSKTDTLRAFMISFEPRSENEQAFGVAICYEIMGMFLMKDVAHMVIGSFHLYGTKEEIHTTKRIMRKEISIAMPPHSALGPDFDHSQN